MPERRVTVSTGLCTRTIVAARWSAHGPPRINNGEVRAAAASLQRHIENAGAELDQFNLSRHRASPARQKRESL